MIELDVLLFYQTMYHHMPYLCFYFLGSPHIGFANAAYDATGDEEHQSEEELHEIRRVSQVPFHSDTDTYLNKVRLQVSQIIIFVLHCIIS